MESRLWRSNALSLASCSASDLSYRNGRPLSIQTRGTDLKGNDREFTLQGFSSESSLFFYFKKVQSSLFFLLISIHALSTLHQSTEALAPMREHKIGTKTLAELPRTHHTSYETSSVIE